MIIICFCLVRILYNDKFKKLKKAHPYGFCLLDIISLLPGFCLSLMVLFGILVSLNSVIAVLDADFHSLPSTQHREQYGPVSLIDGHVQALYF